MQPFDSTQITDADRCLLRNSALLSLTKPDVAGLLHRRSNSISGWYQYWFSLHGSQLHYFVKGQSNRRGLLVGTISLFRHKLIIINSLKRRREFEILDTNGKQHILRADTDAEMHWWIQVITEARNKIPPAQPIDRSLGVLPISPSKNGTKDEGSLPRTIVDTHLKVDHLLCVVHGIGGSFDILSGNIRQLQESYLEVMRQVFPDVDFRVEFIFAKWHQSLTNLDVHKKLQAVLPRAPVSDDTANPLRQIMVHRIVDYVYYTHSRYRHYILREIASQLNEQVAQFRKRRPEFDGKISIMGHSLGAALCYELMCRKVQDDQVMLASEGLRLEFDAANLFCMGNPLGILLGLDPSIGLGCDMRSLPFRIFNVFKYHDPVATRLEPCIDSRRAEIPPVTVPCWTNMGLRESTAEWLGTLWPGQKRQTELTKEREDSIKNEMDTSGDILDQYRPKSPKEGRNESKGSSPRPPSSPASGYSMPLYDTLEHMGSRRLDFALQVTSTLEEVSTTWGAFCSHTEYWGNRDVMLLMVSSMMKSTFGIDDDIDDRIPEEISRRIIDANILEKSAVRYEDEMIRLQFVVKSVLEEVIVRTVAATSAESKNTNEISIQGARTNPGSSWTSYLTPGWFRETSTEDGI